ncbi:tubulin tyrosine ligase-like 4A isoform X2 [Haematobia irritans]|uniref:tubulin tyrosine ligase-like 4A isoform X2 n=1 Tax=Haematobia irritans TaxID=7368 RepID=UPI003F503B96
MSSNYNSFNNHRNDGRLYEYLEAIDKVASTQSKLSKINDITFKNDDLDGELRLFRNHLGPTYRSDNELNLQHHHVMHSDNLHLQENQHFHTGQHHYYSGTIEKIVIQHISGNNSPPKRVQLHHRITQNNNIQRNCGRYSENPQSSMRSLEFSRELDFQYLGAETDYYQQNYPCCCDPNTSMKSYMHRSLPSTRNMPSSKNILQSSDDLTIDKYRLIEDPTNFSDHSDSNSENGNQVLREKAANNNEESTDRSWLYDTFDTTAADCSGAYMDSIATVDYKRSKYFDEAKLMRTRKSVRKSPCLLNGDQRDHMNTISSRENHNSHLSRNHAKLDENGQNLPGLESPASYKDTFKKPSPPSKSRRVLIYSSQSPRLSKFLLRKRIQRPRKAHIECNSDIPRQPIDNRSHESKIAILTKYRNGTLIKKHTYEKDYYSEESDDDYDLDNASEVDETDDSDVSSDSEDCYRSHAYKLTHNFDELSTTGSITSSLNSDESLSNPEALLVPSLFPHVPPYLAFSSNAKKGPDVPADLYRILKWRVTNVMPRVVRMILSNSGMRLLKKTNDWMGVWGKHMKSPCFKTVRPYQKINHLPGSFKIGRKDSCWKNLVQLMAKHGKKEFGFMPKTYIIPNDLKQLRKNWPKYSQRNVKWIIKPPASARGSGIKVVDRWTQIPKKKSTIVQKYIERPLLINGSKFDLRLYVLVTSIHPLRVYMYHNGLARFASVKYSDKSDTLGDRCMHLTNYSINKFSSNYSKNEDVNACQGHKWTIKSLWNYLRGRGVRTELLWDSLRSLVLRTILAGENSINNMIRTNVESKYSCFELFGFDVLLDADLIPWLLEVNISPSLHSELPLDAHVKAPLVQSVLNTALYNVPPKLAIERQKEIALEMALQPGPICYDERIYINYLSRSEKIKHSTFARKTMEDRDKYIEAILENLTPDDVRCLLIAEDELARSAPLERIFPTTETYKYLKYTETPRYYNRLLDAWEARYGTNRIDGINLLRQYCEERYHLQVPQIPTKKDSCDYEGNTTDHIWSTCNQSKEMPQTSTTMSSQREYDY